MSIRGKTVNRMCKSCKCTFVARVADVKRGWAKFCSKSCKASHQNKRTGQWPLRENQFEKPSNYSIVGAFFDHEEIQ